MANKSQLEGQARFCDTLMFRIALAIDKNRPKTQTQEAIKMLRRELVALSVMLDEEVTTHEDD